MNAPEELLNIDERKRRALAYLEGYRERMRREREAKAAAEETAEQEIARAIQRRRKDEAARAEIQAERERIYAEREERLAVIEREDREKRRANEPRQLAETSARRLAKLLRRRLGDDFDSVVADIKSVDFKLFKIEVARVPVDERAEALHREREAQAAAALELPKPQDAQEAEILARYGFTT